jgi:hypothetical protein
VPAQAFTTVPVVRVEADRVSVARGAESPVRGGREDVAQPAVPEPAIAARASAARRGSVEAAAVTPDPTERERASSPNIERAPAPASLDPRETPRAPAPAAAHREPVRSPPDAPPPRAPFMRGPDERRRLEEPNEAAPVIHVTIGRVEVRATPPAPPPLPEVPRWQAPVLGLEEFLRRERGRS